MNDFTIKELQGILEALTIIDQDPMIIPEIYWDDDLPLKIIDKIENYCEHEKGGVEHVCYKDVCAKCGKPW